jgi:hypothetical protein
MGEAPPHSVQLSFLRKVEKELETITEPWEHAVSKEWVAEVRRCLEAEDGAGATIPPMFVSDWDSSNLYVGEKNWQVLASWYGVQSKYSFRRRTTVSAYISIGGSSANKQYILADNRIDFVITFCCLLKDISTDQSKRPFIDIYIWESLDYVEFQVRCMLKIRPEKAVRLWLSLYDDGADRLLENLSVYDRYTSSVGSVLCEKLPELMDILQKRQTLPTLNSNAGLFDGMEVKEELTMVFAAQQWRLTLCLEELPIPTNSASATSPQYAIPKSMQNLHLDHIFGKDESKSGDLDEDLKKLLDDSVQEMNAVILEHRHKLERRSLQLLEEAKESCKMLEQQLKDKLNGATTKEEQLNTREKELNEREHALNSKLSKFKAMLTEFLTKKDRFEKDTERIVEQNRITASRIELNVGGVRYTTAVATLLKEEGSLLHTMFSGQHALTPDKDGSYFIDRDGTNFRYILNFLRDGPASVEHLPGADLHLLSEVRAEAEHYQLSRLVDTVRARMKMAEGRGNGDFVSLPS